MSRTPSLFHLIGTYQQVKTIYKLTLNVQDEIGDLAHLDNSFESLHESIIDVEARLMKIRDELEKVASRRLTSMK